MTGICGWFGACEDDPRTVLHSMCQRITWAGAPGQSTIAGDGYGLAAVGAAGTVGTYEFDNFRVAFHGHGHWRGERAEFLTPEALCTRMVEAYRQNGPAALAMLGGDFSLAILDVAQQQLLLAVDRMGVRNLVYRRGNGATVFAPNLDSLAVHPAVSHLIVPQALYNYVYFHMVPGPETVYAGSLRLLRGHYLVAREGACSMQPYWEIGFDESRSEDSRDLANRFREVLRSATSALTLPAACGTFLSGGTDSSTVTGLLAGLSGNAVDTFSIGFDADGYDEMNYARIAARHFKTTHHEYYVTPADVVAALPLIAAEYDQPFGNASAVPTYYCAKLARAEGMTRLLAGDGGDELFGGNSRYARQFQLAMYELLPTFLRTGVIEPLTRYRILNKVPLVRKGLSYVQQARMPMPARYESYNLLEHLGPEQVFDAGFLASVDRRRPLAQLTTAYNATDAESLINRMLALDLRFTLADNDLPKVTRMCDRAGIDVAFPLLHDSVVEFAGSLPPRLKLRGTRLRYFFKKALQDFLPPEVIAKQKHGFGLPIGPWLVQYEPLLALTRDALSNLGTRGVIRREFIDDLIDNQLHRHPGYYGTMAWILLMLELWFRHHVDPK